MDYKQGQLHKSESGDYYQLVGESWLPYKGITPDDRELARNVVSPDQKLMSGVMGLADALGGENYLPQLMGITTNQYKAQLDQSRQTNPLSTLAGGVVPAVVGSMIAGPEVLPQAFAGAVTGALASPDDPFMGGAIGGTIGGAVPLAFGANLSGMSGMSQRVLQSADSGAVLTPGMATGSSFLQGMERFAPTFTGVNQVAAENNQLLSRAASRAVGQSGDAPLTAQSFEQAKKATATRFSDVGKSILDDNTEVVKQSLAADLEGSFGGTHTIGYKTAMDSLNKNLDSMGETMTGSDWIALQSNIGKDARKLYKDGDRFSADALDNAHTVVMDKIKSLIPEEMQTVFGSARQQYRAQALLGRSGVIAGDGSVNNNTIYNALRKVNDTDGPLAELKALSVGVKDMPTGATGSTMASDLTKRGLSAGLGSIVGGLPGALLGGALEPIIASGSSKLYRAMAGRSAMAENMAKIGAQQQAKRGGRSPLNTLGDTYPSPALNKSILPPQNEPLNGIPVSPNAGTFRQGGGVGGWQAPKEVPNSPQEIQQQLTKLGVLRGEERAAVNRKEDLKQLTRDLLKDHPVNIQGTQDRFGQWVKAQQAQGVTNSGILSKVLQTRPNVTAAPSIGNTKRDVIAATSKTPIDKGILAEVDRQLNRFNK